MKNFKVNDEAIKAINEGRDIPDQIGDFKLVYHANDGWRGYYEAKAIEGSGWVYKTDGWVTGNWGDAGDHAADVVEANLNKMADKAKTEGKEMIVVLLPTSNVFSTAFDVFVRPLATF